MSLVVIIATEAGVVENCVHDVKELKMSRDLGVKVIKNYSFFGCNFFSV